MLADHTETDPDKIRAKLAKVREQGYSASSNEREISAASVSAPIFSHSGKVVAALAVSGVDSRFTEEKIQEYLSLLIPTVMTISRNIGYSPKEH